MAKKPKPDRDAERAREEMRKKQKAEEQRLEDEKNRRRRMSEERGTGLASFFRSNQGGLLKKFLGDG